MAPALAAINKAAARYWKGVMKGGGWVYGVIKRIPGALAPASISFAV